MALYFCYFFFLLAVFFAVVFCDELDVAWAEELAFERGFAVVLESLLVFALVVVLRIAVAFEVELVVLLTVLAAVFLAVFAAGLVFFAAFSSVLMASFNALICFFRIEILLLAI